MPDVTDSPVLRSDASVALSEDWDNRTRRIRNTGTAEVSAAAPVTPVTGLFWWDTDATGSSVSSTVNQITVTADYTLTADDVAVNGNGVLTLTLPTAVGISGKGYELTNTGTGLVTVACDGSETINGGATAVLSPGSSILVRSDNANWFIK